MAVIVAGNATFDSPCRSVGRSVRPSVGPSVGSSVTLYFVAFLSCLKIEMFRYEYLMDVNGPAQIITAPAQPPATGVAVYTAWFH